MNSITTTVAIFSTSIILKWRLCCWPCTADSVMRCLFITSRLDIRLTIRPVNAAKFRVTVRYTAPAYEGNHLIYFTPENMHNSVLLLNKPNVKCWLWATECLCLTEKHGMLRVKWVMLDDAGLLLYKALQGTPSYDRWGGNQLRRKEMYRIKRNAGYKWHLKK